MSRRSAPTQTGESGTERRRLLSIPFPRRHRAVQVRVLPGQGRIGLFTSEGEEVANLSALDVGKLRAALRDAVYDLHEGTSPTFGTGQ